MWKKKTKVLYILYQLTASWLPESRHFKPAKTLRAFWAKRIIKTMGNNVNIERNARFSPELQVGDGSGIGVDCELYGPVTIGNNVMMGPECVFYTQNHRHDINSELPFGKQGYEETKPIAIGNNVWIGRRVMFMPGSGIGDNSIIAAGAILTKTFPANVLVGGAPARVLKTYDKRII